jgi:hypothetical protein
VRGPCLQVATNSPVLQPGTQMVKSASGVRTGTVAYSKPSGCAVTALQAENERLRNQITTSAPTINNNINNIQQNNIVIVNLPRSRASRLGRPADHVLGQRKTVHGFLGTASCQLLTLGNRTPLPLGRRPSGNAYKWLRDACALACRSHGFASAPLALLSALSCHHLSLPTWGGSSETQGSTKGVERSTQVAWSVNVTHEAAVTS